MLVIGLLVTVSFLSDRNQILATLFVLAIADGVAPLFSKYSGVKLFYNKSKTAGAVAAFFLISLLTYVLIGPIAVSTTQGLLTLFMHGPA